MHGEEKERFARELKEFAGTLGNAIASGGAWTIRGFIDIFQNVYSISHDTKVISKVLELHLFPHFLSFSERIGYNLELASFQNWYPDLTFVQRKNEKIKFAVDLKTTYRDAVYPGFCNGFTLGSHGEYFINRESAKNIQYPYNQYAGHFCLGIIYSRAVLDPLYETRVYSVDDVAEIPAVIQDFTFFAEEKWIIASDKGGSGNTANIGSIQKIDDILTGNGVFAKAGESIFDDYWANFGVLRIPTTQGSYKKLSSLPEYLAYRGLPAELYNPRAKKKKGGVL
ncbi:MAG: EcoRV family type II restriction endonuclease [Oscillibacter sp.]|nr:EcoRV family type II restriction endonuclease [Oscillibacter sp.]